MFKRISDFFSGFKMTLVSGLFLFGSLALLIVKNWVDLDISPFLDPRLDNDSNIGLSAFVSCRIAASQATLGVQRFADNGCHDRFDLHRRNFCGR